MTAKPSEVFVVPSAPSQPSAVVQPVHKRLQHGAKQAEVVSRVREFAHKRKMVLRSDAAASSTTAYAAAVYPC